MWRKIALGAIVALPLALAPAAGAATVPISIGKSAYSPNPAAATTADTVQFTNADTVAHTVAFKATTGVTCSPSSVHAATRADRHLQLQGGRHFHLLRPDTLRPCRGR